MASLSIETPTFGQRAVAGHVFRGEQFKSRRAHNEGQFDSFSDFMGAIINAGGTIDARNDVRSYGIPDVRLKYESSIPTTIGSELSGVDGGFLIPPQFSGEILSKLFSSQSLLTHCDVRTTKTGSLYIPTDQSTPWAPNSGIVTKWAYENFDMSTVQSKIAYNGITLKTHKLFAFLPVSDELAADANMMAEHVSATAPVKLKFAVEKALISGTGAGQPRGIIGSGGTVVIAKEVSQAAATILHQNIVKMWGALPAAAKANAIWVTHPDTDVQLMQLGFPTTASTGSGAPVYQMPTADAPYGSLLGRPIYQTEACSVLGAPGDIILLDPTAYVVAMKTLAYATSIHLFFNQDMSVLRFVLRIDGQPWTNSLFPSLVGGGQRGFFVVLAQR